MLSARWQCWSSLEAVLRGCSVPFKTDFSADVCAKQRRGLKGPKVMFNMQFWNEC